MNRYIFIVLLVFSKHQIFAQSIKPLNAENNALGSVQSQVLNSWTPLNNAALMPTMKTNVFGISYSNLYKIKELKTLSSSGLIKLGKSSAFGLVYSYAGYEVHNTQNITLAYGLGLSKLFTLGLSGGVVIHKIAEIQVSKPFVFHTNISSNYIINPKLSSSIIAKIVFPNSYFDGSTSSLLLGFRYKAGKSTFLIMEAEQKMNERLQSRLGIMHQPFKKFSFMFGMGLNPTQMSFGFKYILESIQFTSSTARHSILGFSPSFSLEYKKTVEGEK